MIFVDVAYAQKISEDWLKTRFVPSFQASVAKHMEVPLAEVEVHPRAFSPLDIHRCDLRIVVSSSRYNSRQSLTQLQIWIIRDVAAELSSHISVSIWMRPAEGSYVEFCGEVDDCIIARRLLSTLAHGNDLVPESEFWLRTHASACDGCRSAWDAVQPVVH